jgi:glutathione S-transferase
MRPWVLLKQFDIPFQEKLIALGVSDTASNIAAFSPSGRLPCWIEGDTVVWDSLAICETLAERYVQHALWPRDPAQRARARAVSAEMHAGFGALRTAMPMNIRGRASARDWSGDVLADIARIDALWCDCLAASNKQGNAARRDMVDESAAGDSGFLFGSFSIADAMFVPVAMRFNTYPVRLSPAASGYVQRLTALSSVQAWTAAAVLEPAIGYYETVL